MSDRSAAAAAFAWGAAQHPRIPCVIETLELALGPSKGDVCGEHRPVVLEELEGDESYIREVSLESSWLRRPMGGLGFKEPVQLLEVPDDIHTYMHITASGQTNTVRIANTHK